MVKDEADLIVASVLAMAEQVDRITVIDNGSTDGTRDLLAQLPVVVIDEPEVGYYQSERMTWLALMAHEQGAEWIIPFDADEVWSARSASGLVEQLGGCNGDVVGAALFDHLATGHDDRAERNPLARMRWRRRDSVPLPKVAVRARPDIVIGQGNHVAHADVPLTIEPGFPLMVRHFSNRSVEQFVRKARNGARAYAASILPESMGTHWRQYGTMTDDELAALFCAAMWIEDPESDPSLVFDPLP